MLLVTAFPAPSRSQTQRLGKLNAVQEPSPYIDRKVLLDDQMEELGYVTSFQTLSDIFFEWHVLDFFLKNEDWSSNKSGFQGVQGSAAANQRFLATFGASEKRRRR